MCWAGKGKLQSNQKNRVGAKSVRSGALSAPTLKSRKKKNHLLPSPKIKPPHLKLSVGRNPTIKTRPVKYFKLHDNSVSYYANWNKKVQGKGAENPLLMICAPGEAKREVTPVPGGDCNIGEVGTGDRKTQDKKLTIKNKSKLSIRKCPSMTEWEVSSLSNDIIGLKERKK